MLLTSALSNYSHRCTISEYEPSIIKSGIIQFDNEKTYLDTSCVEGINNIFNGEAITYSKRPSRANMQPVKSSVWFAKMKGSNKIIVITDNDEDLIERNILSTGFLGIESNAKLPLSLLTSIIISDDFNTQRDLNSVGTTMAGVNNETFLKIQVPLLSLDAIKSFDEKHSSLIYEMSLLRRKINNLKIIKATLLKKYF